ncbi:hypothetical protein [Jeotgalibacillus aurantiacus]|uniref:hypothetical protein n=1 Tax=Jeotgalibacillus aurantiacus TaxID=2763266 RepID=UPI001D0AA0B0|nr:hypothetical protein [Jeotgalibacillus aurantiacus]
MFKIKSVLFVGVLIAGLVIMANFLTAYRLTPLGAAELNEHISEDYELMDEYEMDGVTVFLFKSDLREAYRAVISEKQEFFYSSISSTYVPYDDRESPIYTIGGINYRGETKEFTYFTFQSSDDQISYIEVTEGEEVKKEEVKQGELTTIVLDQDIPLKRLNAVAYDEDGNALYKYGYLDGQAQTARSLKWHPADQLD